MNNTYLKLLNSKGNEDFRNIVLSKDFEEYRKKLKRLTALQKQLKNIETSILGPIDEINTFHDLYIYSCFTNQPIMVFDLINNTVTFYKKDIGFCRTEDKKVEVKKFNLDKLNLFSEETLSTMRYLYLEKLKRSKNDQSGELINDLLERFLILLVSNYQYISYANGDILKAIDNYELIQTFINFSKDNDSIKNETLEEFVELFLKYVILNDDVFVINNFELETPSLEGLKELFDIYHSCLNICVDNLEKEPDYEFLIDEFLDLSRYVLEYEEKLPK